jgi:hypothetical protein
MRGRPPLQTITLKHSGRTLCNDETVSSILADVDSDDEESDAEDTIGEEEIDKLKLTLDMLPPIDPKFGTEMKEKADSMSTKELLNAYCLNVVGMRLGMELSEAEMEEYEKLIAGSTDEGVDGNEEIESQCEEKSIVNQSLQIRKRAALLQKQMEISFGDETIQLMEQEHERIKAYLAEGAEHASTSEVVYGLVPEAALSQRNRRGRSVRGGATMNIKRVLQRNMNVVSHTFQQRAFALTSVSLNFEMTALTHIRPMHSELGRYNSKLPPIPILWLFRRAQLILPNLSTPFCTTVLLPPDSTCQGGNQTSILCYR